MSLTDYHAKLYAHELTRRCSSDSVEKFASVLADAQVDLNPHQVEAALFAFRNPFSPGAILADEVGLGKTIEAGLLLSQKWAERKSEDDEVEMAFTYVMNDPRYKSGTRIKGGLNVEVKRFIVEMYEKATGKKLLPGG